MQKICTERKKVVILHSQTGETRKRTNNRNDSVAQLVEQMTLNHWVVGSSPTGVTDKSNKMLKDAEID